MDDDETELAPEAGLEVDLPEEAEAAAPEPEAEKTATQKRRERERAARERAFAEKQAAEQRAAEAQAKLDRIKSAGASDAKPSPEQYPDPIEHTAALAVWNMTRTMAGRETSEAEASVKAAREQASHAAQAEEAELARIWAEHAAEAKTRYADFAAVVERPDLEISVGLAKEIMRSDTPADLAYHLASNPEVVARLNTMPVDRMAREIGRIEATLSAPRPRTATKAPDPISPVRGSAGTRDPAKMTPAEYAEWRRAGGTFKL